MDPLHKYFKVMKNLYESDKLTLEEKEALSFIAGWVCAGAEESDTELQGIWFGGPSE